MPIVLILGGIGLTASTGWAFSKAAPAIKQASNLTKWVVIGGCVYASYRVYQTMN